MYFLPPQLSALGYMRLAIWLLFLEDDRSVDNVLSGLHVPFDCRFLVAQSEGDAVRLTEVYRVTANHPLTLNHHGIWKKGYPIFNQVNIYERRNDLQGLVIKAITQNVCRNIDFNILCSMSEMDTDLCF
jgi:hypothetical protein